MEIVFCQDHRSNESQTLHNVCRAFFSLSLSLTSQVLPTVENLVSDRSLTSNRWVSALFMCLCADLCVFLLFLYVFLNSLNY